MSTCSQNCPGPVSCTEVLDVGPFADVWTGCVLCMLIAASALWTAGGSCQGSDSVFGLTRLGPSLWNITTVDQT